MNIPHRHCESILYRHCEGNGTSYIRKAQARSNPFDETLSIAQRAYKRFLHVSPLDWRYQLLVISKGMLTVVAACNTRNPECNYL